MAGAAAFLIAAIYVYVNMVKPLFTDIAKVRGDMSARQNVLSAQDSAVRQVKKLLGAYQEQEQFKEAVSASLPVTPNMAGVVSQINAIAAINRMKMQYFSAAPPVIDLGSNKQKKADQSIIYPTGSLILQTKAVGTYEDFKNFLRDLESNVRVTDVKELSVTPAAKPEQDLYSFEFKLAAYYQMSSKTAAN